MFKNCFFSKYQAAGNDFILIEDLAATFPEEKTLVQQLCHRQLGIGSDGLILLRRSKIADFKMVFFNADGTLANMCGNGLRCFGRFLWDLGYEKELYAIEVGKQVLTVKCNQRKTSTFLKKPRVLFWDVAVEKMRAFVVDVGVPHAVIFTDDLSDVLSKGKKIRHAPVFQPKGVNVDFAQLANRKKIVMRTFERGVEGETLACGTGAAATVFVAHCLGLCEPEVKVIPRSLEPIQIQLSQEIEVSGPVVKVFDGKSCTFFQNRI